MTHGNKALLQASMLLLCGCARGQTNANLEKQATALLLQRHETVVSARTRVLSRLHPDDPNQDPDTISLSLPFVYLMGGLKILGPNTLRALEGGAETVLTGARDFVRPEGLGMVSFRTCYITILKPGAAQTLAQEFSKVKVVPMDGRPVWTWSMQTGSEGSKTLVELYAATLTSSFFVLANDLEDFREVTNALSQRTTQAELPGGHDLTALRARAYWAYRAIRRSDARDILASGLTQLPVSALGLELSTDLDNGKLVFNILVPDAQSGPAPADLPSSESIRFRRAGPGIWQAVIDLAASGSAPTRRTTFPVLRVMSYFGYGVFL